MALKNWQKTTILTICFCVFAVSLVLFVQTSAEKNLGSINCSYLDPITFDILAFLFAAFLVIEGIYRIVEHSNITLKHQLTRSIRIAFGCAILSIHLMQYMYK